MTDDTGENLEYSINFFWKIMQTFNIFMMQLGFVFVESGTVRKQHVTSNLLKNICDTCIGAMCWFFFGFAFAYGKSKGGIIGFSNFAGYHFHQDDLYVEWLNSFTFATTAATIISGSIAERIRLKSYIFITTTTELFVYPIIVHWVWSEKGWLKDLGYLDFAGCGPVHMIGGLTGLIVTYKLGPRYIKKNEKRFDNKKSQIQPFNIPFVILGTFILFYSWYGFNAGSQSDIYSVAGKLKAGKVSKNTTISAVAGGLTAFVIQQIQWRLEHKKFPVYNDAAKQLTVQASSMGLLSGLISITAGCDGVQAWMACIIGCIGSIIYLTMSKVLIYLKIDDPLDASTIHYFCGIWGLISTGLFYEDFL
ncbi:Ammonium transporter AmtB-like domain [Pseudocohnilembus persalinus]|uniref:Ammonium transporter AmtB-like domain n=1 Tax=Pseudocohnilembus persalinus TaxID=266149 RepID=A0A0V0QRW3_PSEPJ|nr:Ammonium transporter AmtB-like domain [Pseudocohnilembus persalinus]|eukprot:KRX04909.1 Ammonium transporter AmtB-like domain [Pseudocohnilembus persalinus]